MQITINLEGFGIGDGDLLWTNSTIIATAEVNYQERWGFHGNTECYEGPYVESVEFDVSLGIGNNEASIAYAKFLEIEYGVNKEFKAKINAPILAEVPQYQPRRAAV